MTLAAEKPPTRVNVEVRDGVAVIELDGVRVRNALHSSTHRAIQTAFDELDDRGDVGAMLVCGAGGSFCSGSDLREIGPMRDDEIMRHVRLDFLTKNRVAGSMKPVVAAIQGHCVGGGVELAIACDIRVASDDAQFAMTEVSLGGHTRLGRTAETASAGRTGRRQGVDPHRKTFRRHRGARPRTRHAAVADRGAAREGV